MHRIDHATKNVDEHGAGKHGFTEGDPAGGVAPTVVTDDWLDAIQEEIANVVEYTGELDKPTNTQLLTVLRQLQGLTADVNYTEVSNPKNFGLVALATDGASTIVAVGGADGVDAYIATSVTGQAWTERANPKDFSLNGVAWSPTLNLFCAVGEPDGVDAYIATSPDGVTWTERANPKNKPLQGITWVGGSINLFVAVGERDGTDAYLVTSPDGTTWTERANPGGNFDLNGVAWDGVTNLVAVGSIGSTDAYIATSTDGTNWTERANPKNIALTEVRYISHLSRFVAVGIADGVDAYIVTSDDLGVTWTERSNPENLSLYGLDYDGVGQMIATGSAGSAYNAYILRSFNGEDWFPIVNPKDYRLAAALFETTLNSWIFSGDTDGADAYLLQSLFRK